MDAQYRVEPERNFSFGAFALSPGKRLLTENGRLVPLGSRATELLIILTERHGQLVTKDELMARVWPRTVVVEGNLTAQMTALRRALRDGRGGNRFIVNDPGRGYRFVAPVTVAEASEPPMEGEPAPAGDRLLSLMRLAVQRSRAAGSSPHGERQAIEGMLLRGIQALELARTLVARAQVTAKRTSVR